jgi:hypothetical protein
MAIVEIAPRHGDGAHAPLPRLVESACLAIVLAEAIFLVGSYDAGTWLVSCALSCALKCLTIVNLASQ